jgi:hypothetical protein
MTKRSFVLNVKRMPERSKFPAAPQIKSRQAASQKYPCRTPTTLDANSV